MSSILRYLGVMTSGITVLHLARLADLGVGTQILLTAAIALTTTISNIYYAEKVRFDEGD